MNIVPIIADGRLIKNHTEYPVTNNQWKLITDGLGLWDYLTTLKLSGDNNYQMMMFAGIRDFYLRVRYNNNLYTTVEFNSDPWGRKFMIYPPEKKRNMSVYSYYSCRSAELYLDVNIIVTTVNKSKVYCVDVVRLK